MINLFKETYCNVQNNIDVFESFLNINLPKDFRMFLLKINGGIPKKSFFTYGENEGSVINCFFGITGDINTDIVKYYKKYKGTISENFIPIGEDQGGNLLMIAVSGKDYGKLFFMDHELPVFFLADSFEEFINSLKSEEEIEALLNKDSV